jgi:hypothetical protein
VVAVSVCFGSWLYPGKYDRPHAIEMQEVSIDRAAEK